MTPKIFVVMFLLASYFGCIQNEQQQHAVPGFSLWTKNAVIEHNKKELERTKFSKEFLPVSKNALPIEEEEEDIVSSGDVMEVESHHDARELSNRLRRAIINHYRFPIRYPASMESMEANNKLANHIKRFNEEAFAELERLEEDSEEMSDPKTIT